MSKITKLSWFTVIATLALAATLDTQAASGLNATLRPVAQRVHGASLRADRGNHSFRGMDVAVGATSTPFELRITNDGDALITGLVAETHGDFTITRNSCPAELPPTRLEADSCHISVAFRPSSAGRRTGDLTLRADNLAATVLPLDAGTPIQFGTVQLGSVTTEWVEVSASAPLSGTVTGPFKIALQGIYEYDSINGIAFGAAASGTPAGGAFYLGVQLQATTLGSAQGTVTLSDGTTYAVSATVATVDSPMLSPTSIQFPYVPIGGSTANPAPFTLTNNSHASIPISSIQVGAPFSSTSNCGATLAAGATCTIQVTFVPTSTSEVDGQLIVVTGTSELAATLQGFGATNPEDIAISPADTFLSYTHPGDVSPAQTWTVKNLNADRSVSVLLYATNGACSATLTSDCAEVVNTNCGTVAPLASCQLTFQYVFGPPAGDAGGNTTLIVTRDGDAGSLYAFSFEVTGPTNAGTSDLAAYPAPITFPVTAVGQASEAQVVTLANASPYPLTLSARTGNGFSAESNCTTIAPGQTCGLSTHFTPVDAGPAFTYFEVTGVPPAADSSWGETTASFVAYAFASPGAAVLASPAYPPLDYVTLTPNAVSDGTHVSFAMPVRNIGTGPLDISDVYFTSQSGGGMYVDPSQCAAPVAPGSECVLTVTFDAEGCPADGSLGIPCTSEANLYVGSNALSSPDTYVLVALDNPSSVSNPLNPGAATAFYAPDFGSVTVGQTATFSVTYSGVTGPIPAFSLTGSNSFILNNGCASVVGSRTASCTVTVTFAPTSVGFATASIKAVTSLGLTTESLAGNGIAGANVLGVSPASEAFPSTIVGAASGAQALILTNSGSGSLNFSSFTVSGQADDFVLSNGCAGSLAPSARCTINISFNPVSAGSKAATLEITDNAAGSPQSVKLTGVATNAPILALSATNEAFPDTVVGATSPAQTLTLSNVGSALLNFSSFAVSGQVDDFVLANGCGSSLAPGASCTINLSFKPVSTGSKAATLKIADNAAGSPQSVALSGVTTSGAILTPSAASEVFPTTVAGSMSAPKILTLTNTGTAVLSFASFMLGGEPDDFVLANNCGTTLAPSASCTISITFKPASAGFKSATLGISDNAPGSPQSVALTGIGASSPMLTLSAASEAFSPTAVGSTSAPSVLTLKNTGTASVSLASFTVSGQADDFLLSNGCGGSLAASASCAISISFKPVSAGSKSATLSISDNAPASPQRVALTGAGISP